MSLGSLPTLSMLGISPTDEATPLSAPAASASTTPSLWQDAEEAAELTAPSIFGPLNAVSQSSQAANAGKASWLDSKRWVTLILGFILIMAGLFAHSGVRETIISTGKKVGEAAAVAA